MAGQAEVGALVEPGGDERVVRQREQRRGDGGRAAADPAADVAAGARHAVGAQRGVAGLLGERRVAGQAASAVAGGELVLGLGEQAGRRGGAVQRAVPLADLFGVAARALPRGERRLGGRERRRRRALWRDRPAEHGHLVGVAQAGPDGGGERPGAIGGDRLGRQAAAIDAAGERDDVIGERPDVGVGQRAREARHRGAGQAGRDAGGGGAAVGLARPARAAGAARCSDRRAARAARTSSARGRRQRARGTRGSPWSATARRRARGSGGGGSPRSIGGTTGSPVTAAGANARTTSITSSSWSAVSAANAGIAVPGAPSEIVARTSSSLAGRPTGTDRHFISPRVNARGAGHT